MKSEEKKEWCIALGNINAYHDPILGTRFMFLKGERATKEKVFSMIPEMTEEKYAELFRPATEEEINGEFDWDGYQYILKKETKCMTREEKASVLGHEPLTFEQMKEIEAMHLQHDWDALRNQAAIAAMQGMLSNPQSYLGEGDTYPKAAVRFSNELIEELKKKQSV